MLQLSTDPNQACNVYVCKLLTLMVCLNRSIIQLYQKQTKSFGNGLGWIIDSLETVRSNHQQKLDHPRKRLIDVQNTDDNDCFKWCLIRYLNPADCKPARIKKSDKDFAKNFDFEDLKFPVRVRDIRKIEKKNSINISVFALENKEKHPIYVSKICCGKHPADLLMTEEKDKRHYVLIYLCIIILYIMEKLFFAVIACKLLVQKKY